MITRTLALAVVSLLLMALPAAATDFDRFKSTVHRVAPDIYAPSGRLLCVCQGNVHDGWVGTLRSYEPLVPPGDPPYMVLGCEVSLFDPQTREEEGFWVCYEFFAVPR